MANSQETLMNKLALSFCLVGALTLTVPALGMADSGNCAQGKDLLEQQLQPGQPLSTYRGMLRNLGYTITSVNDNTPDYIEYDVVKGDRSYEIRIDLDEDTGRATNIDIASNFGRTDRTEAARDHSESDQTAALHNPDYVLVITPVYIATNQARTKMGRMVEELEALPIGKDKQFYRWALERQGYQITDRASKGNRTQFNAEKNGMKVLLNVRFDEDTGESTQLSAFPLLTNIAQSTAPQMEKSSRSLGMERMLQELKVLPVGHGKRFYRDALRERGYQITDTTISRNGTQFEAEKNGQHIALNLTFDDQGKSTEIEASRSGERQESSARLPRAQQSRQSERFTAND
jgi:hypothetical protein